MRVTVYFSEPINLNYFIEIQIGRVSMNDAHVRVLSDLVQVYSKYTVQACQHIIAENGKTINLFLIYLQFLLELFLLTFLSDNLTFTFKYLLLSEDLNIAITYTYVYSKKMHTLILLFVCV